LQILQAEQVERQVYLVELERQTRWLLQVCLQLVLRVVLVGLHLVQVEAQAAQAAFRLLLVEVEELLDLHQDRLARVEPGRLELQLLQPTSNQ
jgi:hypothetical protein